MRQKEFLERVSKRESYDHECQRKFNEKILKKIKELRNK